LEEHIRDLENDRELCVDVGVFKGGGGDDFHENKERDESDKGIWSKHIKSLKVT
jgi:hypothetical protein